jgi:hypothetical protein
MYRKKESLLYILVVCGRVLPSLSPRKKVRTEVCLFFPFLKLFNGILWYPD